MRLKKVLIYILILLFGNILFAQENHVSNDKSVLILFSGSHDFRVNRNMFVTFEKVLSPNNIRVVAEYLGDDNSVYFRDKEAFLNFYRQKYGEYQKFDLVIAFNKEAIELCVNHNEELFPDTDVLGLDIFGDIGFLLPYTKQLEVIDNIHKDLKHLLIVSDNTIRGKILKENVKAYIDSVGFFNDKPVYIDFAELDYSDIKRYRYYSQKESAILLLSAYQDSSLMKKEFSEQISFLDRELNLPIYSLYEKVDEEEVVGGYYFDVDNMVKQLSIKIILILNNMPIEEVDFTDMMYYRMFFNQDIADKYGLDIQQYQDEAIINISESADNRMQYIVKLVRKIVIFAIYVLLGLFIYTVIRNRKYKKELSQYKNIADEVLNKSLHYIFFVDVKTNIIINYNNKVAKSDFSNYVINNESKITDFFPAQIESILNSKEVANSHSLHEFDFNIKDKTFPALLTSFNFYYDKQEIAYLQFSDNSEYKQEVMELKKMKDEADNRVHESANLITNMARELKDPLNVKRGFEKLLTNDGVTVDERKEYIKTIHFNSTKIFEIIEKVIIYSELNNNTIILTNQQFSLNKCIREITNDMQNEIKEKGKKIKLVNYFSLSEEKDVLFNDREYFCLVFQELLENAVKFTQSGTVECGYTHPNDGKIIFYIKDSGSGMSLEEQRVAFNKINHKLNSTNKSNLPGIGIGLAICRNLVSKMGGNIWLISKKNEGTTAHFYLDYDMSVFNESLTMLQQSDINILKKKNILIIDEDMGNIKFIIQTLKKYSITAKTMPNYQSYGKYGESDKQFDLIILDYSSGFEEFLKENRLKFIGDNVSLIIMTRTNLKEDIINELKGIRYSIIYKPIKLHELLHAII